MIIVVTDDELEGVLEELDDFLEDMHECGYSLGARHYIVLRSL